MYSEFHRYQYGQLILIIYIISYYKTKTKIGTQWVRHLTERKEEEKKRKRKKKKEKNKKEVYLQDEDWDTLFHFFFIFLIFFTEDNGIVIKASLRACLRRLLGALSNDDPFFFSLFLSFFYIFLFRKKNDIVIKASLRAFFVA